MSFRSYILGLTIVCISSLPSSLGRKMEGKAIALFYLSIYLFLGLPVCSPASQLLGLHCVVFRTALNPIHFFSSFLYMFLFMYLTSSLSSYVTVNISQMQRSSLSLVSPFYFFSSLFGPFLSLCFVFFSLRSSFSPFFSFSSPFPFFLRFLSTYSLAPFITLSVRWLYTLSSRLRIPFFPLPLPPPFKTLRSILFVPFVIPPFISVS